jgi:hypothetical protein
VLETWCTSHTHSICPGPKFCCIESLPYSYHHCCVIQAGTCVMPLSRNSLLRAILQKVPPLLASASPFFIPPTMYYDSQVRVGLCWGIHGCVLCVSFWAVRDVWCSGMSVLSGLYATSP